MFKEYLGIECFGCGTQRSLNLLFHGEFINAFYMFPALYSTLLFFLFLGLHIFDKSRRYHTIVIALAVSNALIMVVSYFYKLLH